MKLLTTLAAITLALPTFAETDAITIPPKICTENIAAYSTNRLNFTLMNGLARTRGGRIYLSWISGGDGPGSFTAIAKSDDGGATWSDVIGVIDGHDAKGGGRTNIIGTFWLDPDGVLHCFTDQSMRHFDGRAGVWEATCKNPDDAQPVWSAFRRLGHGHVINKPIVLKNGDWAMASYLNGTWGKPNGAGSLGAFPELNNERGATCYISSDHGKTWQKRGTAIFPTDTRSNQKVEDWQEAQLIELADGTLRIFARVINGYEGCLMAADSTDGGRTFGAPRVLPSMNNPNSRFQVFRLVNGHLIFVKHGAPAWNVKGKCYCGRERLTAYLSTDDGATWRGGLLLDAKNGSYPDIYEDADGYICVAHDHGRSTDKEIWFHRFNEEDILAGHIVSPRGKLRTIAIKLPSK